MPLLMELSKRIFKMELSKQINKINKELNKLIGENSNQIYLKTF